jgi:CheY-like chemotaxis protein
MARKARILFVDDDERLCKAMKRWLGKKEYNFTVFTASNAEEAQAIADREWLHLAVIDIMLDDNDPDNRVGFDLARRMWSGIPKIFLTVLADGDSMLEGLSNEMKEEANVIGYIRKRDGEQKIWQAILSGLKSLNLDLDIQWGNYTSFMLIEMLKGYRQKDDKEKRAFADELDDLFCKLFEGAKSIDVLDLKRGKGGCAVVLLQPTIEGKGAEMMVKFGSRETIMKEWDNYRKYVKSYVQFGSTVVSDKPTETLHLAAIKYSFVGGAGIEGAFKNYFSSATPENIGLLLDYLFNETCKQWYWNKRSPRGPDERLPLDQLYRSRDSLNLADDKHIREVEAIIEQLLRPEDNLYAPNLQKSGESNLKVSLGPFVQLLPNPLHIALRERLGEEAATRLFPIPTLVATTHGDLNGDNILVSKDNKTFLIDFYKTGLSPVFRDFVVLESIIKFELLQTSNLIQRFNLETALLEPLTFSDPISLSGMEQEHELTKVLFAIKRLRNLAFSATLLADMYEYYVGLLFYALKEIVGFSSGPAQPACCNIKQYHALLSAAKICEKLLRMRPTDASAQGSIKIFLSYASEDEAEVKMIYHRLALEELKPWMSSEDIIGGEVFSLSIEHAIRDADFFLPILTKNSVNKRGFRQRENKQALDLWLEKMARDIYIIPTRLDDCEIPEELDKFQSVDLNKEGGWKRLIRAIREGVKRLDELEDD